MYIQMMKKKNKRAQEEMVGFALIIIIVAVILLIFLGFSLTKPSTDNVESYEVESFMQAMLQYTSNCSDNLQRLSIQDLIIRCERRRECADGRKSCDVLKEEIEDIMAESWKIENTPIAGYDMIVVLDDKAVVNISQGNITNNFKGSTLPRIKGEIDVTMNVYY